MCFLCLLVVQWAYELGQASEMKVSVPLHGCEHFYLLTKPLQEALPPSTPGLTHQTLTQIMFSSKFYSFLSKPMKRLSRLDEVKSRLIALWQSPTGSVSCLQWWSTWMAEYMHGSGTGAFYQGALRKIPNPSSLRVATSWRSRTCRRTGTTLVMARGFFGGKWLILLTLQFY